MLVLNLVFLVTQGRRKLHDPRSCCDPFGYHGTRGHCDLYGGMANVTIVTVVVLYGRRAPCSRRGARGMSVCGWPQLTSLVQLTLCELPFTNIVQLLSSVSGLVRSVLRGLLCKIAP